jgi:hypothetical protein
VVTIGGYTGSPNYPTTPGAWDTTYNGGPGDAFVTRLDPSQPSAQQLLYSTFIGTPGDDGLHGFSVDAYGVVTISGATNSPTWPTTPGAWNTTHNGGYDVIVTRLDMLPTGASLYGAATPGCAGPLAIGVGSMPRVGNATFALTCGNAPAAAPGLLALGSAPLATPVAILGAAVWVDPTAPLLVSFFVQSNALGAARVPVPIPANSALAASRCTRSSSGPVLPRRRPVRRSASRRAERWRSRCSREHRTRRPLIRPRSRRG